MTKPTEQNHSEQLNLREMRSRDLAVVELEMPASHPEIRSVQSAGHIGLPTAVATTLGHHAEPFRTCCAGKFGRIEIVIVPAVHASKNVAITIDPAVIQGILQQRFSQVDITTITHQSDLDALAKRKPDLVFSGVKYFHFDDQILWLNEFLDQHHISYIGSAKKALDREYDKTIAKELVQRAGLTTARYTTAHPSEPLANLPKGMHFPVFIKPSNCGDSIGIDDASLAHHPSSMQLKIQQLFDAFNCDVLVEQYLPGNEYSIGIIEHESTKALTAMPIEIRAQKNTHGHRILDFQTKQNDKEEVLPVLNQVIHKKLSDLGKSVFQVLGGSSFGRIDVRMCASGVPHFIEANLMPGLKKGYFYRACALNLGMSYEQMIIGLAENRITSPPQMPPVQKPKQARASVTQVVQPF